MSDEPGYPVIHSLDVERGAVCMDCGKPFQVGDRYATRLLGLAGETLITEVICLGCNSGVTAPGITG
jgi:hypothetical protein